MVWRRHFSAFAAVLLFLALQDQPTANAQSRAENVPFGEASLGLLTEEDVLVLVRTTMIGLDQANKTSNYEVFRSLASPEFAERSLENIAELFATLRERKIDLSYAALIEPIYTIQPDVISDSSLRVAGYFPSFPQQVHFDLLYRPGTVRWEIYGIYVGVRDVVPKPLLPRKP